MKIRTAIPADVDAILAIAATTAWDKDDFLRSEVGSGNVLVADDGASIAGFLAWNCAFFTLPFVWLVAVAPAQRRQGVASELFDAVETACSGRRLFSSTNLSHAEMQRFFERRGYRRSGEVDLDPGDPEVFYQLDP